LNAIHGEDKIILAKWFDIEVGDGIPPSRRATVAPSTGPHGL
jgi:hypothetical protein